MIEFPYDEWFAEPAVREVPTGRSGDVPKSWALCIGHQALGTPIWGLLSPLRSKYFRWGALMCCCEVLHGIEGLATIVRSATPLSTRACKSPTRSLPVPAPQLGTFQPPSSCHLEAWGDSCPQFSHNQQSQCITRFFIRSVGWICCQDANSATLKTNFLSDSGPVMGLLRPKLVEGFFCGRRKWSTASGSGFTTAVTMRLLRCKLCNTWFCTICNTYLLDLDICHP